MLTSTQILITILPIIFALTLVYVLRSRSQVLAEDLDMKVMYRYSGRNVFTYDVFFTDTPEGESIDKGEIDLRGFLAAFGAFPWWQELAKVDSRNVQTPTMSIHDESRKQTLFISITGSRIDGGEYFLGFMKPKEGYPTERGILVRTKKKDEVIRMITAFFDKASDMELVIRTIK